MPANELSFLGEVFLFGSNVVHRVLVGEKNIVGTMYLLTTVGQRHHELAHTSTIVHIFVDNGDVGESVSVVGGIGSKMLALAGETHLSKSSLSAIVAHGTNAESFQRIAQRTDVETIALRDKSSIEGNHPIATHAIACMEIHALVSTHGPPIHIIQCP